MQILGIRVSPSTIRYAIVDWDGINFTFLNRTTENKIDFPVNLGSRGSKLSWLFQELERIVSNYPNIDIIGVKEGEYIGSETLSKRERASLEGIIQYWAYERNIPATMKIYAGIKDVKSREALIFCETNIGKTETYWNKDMSDALLAAWAIKEQ